MAHEVISPSQQDEMVAMFSDGKSYKAIADHFGCALSLVSSVLCSLGISRKTKQNRHRAVFDLSRQGKTRREIAGATGYSEAFISSLMTKQSHQRKHKRV